MVKKRRPNRDPFAEREAKRYANPIPSREFILNILKERGKPATLARLEKLLKIKDAIQLEGLARRLQAMERDGQLHSNRRQEYGVVSKMNLIAGRVIGHRDGYGFVVPDDAGEDLFLPAKYMRAIFDGDRVLVRVTDIDRKGRREAALVQVLECNTLTLIGKLNEVNGMYFVIPSHKRINQEILISPDQVNGAQVGQIVKVEITLQPTSYRRAVGNITEILGDNNQAGMETNIAIRAHGLTDQWTPEVLAEAAQFTELTPNATYADREDLRTLSFVTIDGEDAKDFDDAIFCEKHQRGGWRLIVAIADVSYYVTPQLTLDQEAFKRGNSVYFPDQVIPMLPEALSNGLCSLKPNVDRFSLVCDMQLNEQGTVTRYRFYPAVIHSHARLTYTNVAAALNDDEQPIIAKPMLQEFQRLFLELLANRKKRGALDFDTIETKVLFDKQRKIRAIVPTTRNEAHKMIEEAMLCANVCAARFLVKNKLTTLFRVHEGPTEAKLNDLRDFLKEFNLGLRGETKPTPNDYASLLKTISERPDARIIQTVLLRSLRQAIYTPHNNGHFGLAYEAYTHFTSPIRRYPDLLIHRQIRAVLNGTQVAEEPSRWQMIGEHCSFTERRADEAVRDALDTLKCKFAANRVGETFQGLVTAVTSFGLFVELTDLYIDGLIHISTLPSDYYHFDAAHHRLIGEHSGTTFKLGDALTVEMVKVNIDDKKIDLQLINSQKYGRKRKR